MTREQMQGHATALGRSVDAEVLLDERLAPYLSMRVGGPAAAMVRPRSKDALAAVVRGLATEGVPHRLLGGGSNVLALDRPLPFVVVHVGAVGGKVEWDGARAVAPASTSLAVLLREALRRGLSGLEWAAGLPGTIGGAVSGNAGAFGGEIGSSVRAVTLLAGDGALRRREVREGDFGYRRSFVREGELVVDVELELLEAEPASVRAETARVNRERSSSQPKGGHSSGCMFKNPPGDSAGRLIDACGLKGLSRGGARVSTDHANFVINDGTARGEDILALVQEVRRRVLEETGRELEVEVRVWSDEEVAS